MGRDARIQERLNQMTRVIHFDADKSRDRQDYKLLCDALLTRGSQARDPRTGELPRSSKDDLRSDARLKRALWVLGEPDEEAGVPAPKDDAPDARPRRLIGGTLTLEQPDFDRLERFVGDCQWTVHIVDRAVELMDRLNAATKVSEDGTISEKPEPAKPQRIRRA